jgi:hypothetical protein
MKSRGCQDLFLKRAKKRRTEVKFNAHMALRAPLGTGAPPARAGAGEWSLTGVTSTDRMI